MQADEVLTDWKPYTNRKSKFIKDRDIRAFIHYLNPKAKLTAGFLKFLDVHLESIFRRAAIHKGYLDASAAVMACRYPYHVQKSQIDYNP